MSSAKGIVVTTTSELGQLRKKRQNHQSREQGAQKAFPDDGGQRVLDIAGLIKLVGDFYILVNHGTEPRQVLLDIVHDSQGGSVR